MSNDHGSLQGQFSSLIAVVTGGSDDDSDQSVVMLTDGQLTGFAEKRRQLDVQCLLAEIGNIDQLLVGLQSRRDRVVAELVELGCDDLALAKGNGRDYKRLTSSRSDRPASSAKSPASGNGRSKNKHSMTPSRSNGESKADKILGFIVRSGSAGASTKEVFDWAVKNKVWSDKLADGFRKKLNALLGYLRKQKRIENIGTSSKGVWRVVDCQADGLLPGESSKSEKPIPSLRSSNFFDPKYQCVDGVLRKQVVAEILAEIGPMTLGELTTAVLEKTGIRRDRATLKRNLSVMIGGEKNRDIFVAPAKRGGKWSARLNKVGIKASGRRSRSAPAGSRGQEDDSDPSLNYSANSPPTARKTPDCPNDWQDLFSCILGLFGGRTTFDELVSSVRMSAHYFGFSVECLGLTKIENEIRHAFLSLQEKGLVGVGDDNETIFKTRPKKRKKKKPAEKELVAPSQPKKNALLLESDDDWRKAVEAVIEEVGPITREDIKDVFGLDRGTDQWQIAEDVDDITISDAVDKACELLLMKGLVQEDEDQNLTV